MSTNSENSQRYGCAVGNCKFDYARKSGLRIHQRKHHAKIYEQHGIQLEMRSTKRQKTEKVVIPIVVEKPTGNLEEQTQEIVELKARINELEGRFQSLPTLAGQHAARSATEAVEVILEDRISELFAHILELKEQMILLAKKTTKWCVVCFSKENTYAFLPCRHKCVCKDCATRVFKRFKRCPICRKSISSAKAIYDLSAMQ